MSSQECRQIQDILFNTGLQNPSIKNEVDQMLELTGFNQTSAFHELCQDAHQLENAFRSNNITFMMNFSRKLVYIQNHSRLKLPPTLAKHVKDAIHQAQGFNLMGYVLKNSRAYNAIKANSRVYETFKMAKGLL